MIKIKKIELHNYRQYRSTIIDFPDTEKFHLYVLRAKNGTGKTTLLNSILWCLYGKEYYLTNEEKALPLINESIVEESANNTMLSVTATMTIDDDDRILIFERTLPFLITEDLINNKKNGIPSKEKITITITNKNDPIKNSKVIEDPDETASIIKQYFDEAIFDFYFFDGENLRNYFTKGKSQKIKDSIYNISQVTLLQNSITHVSGMSVDLYRKAENLPDSNTQLYEEQATLKNENEQLIEKNLELNLKIPEWQKIVDNADADLKAYGPIKSMQLRREENSKKLGELEKQKITVKENKYSFIREFATLLNFYPRLKATYDMIIKKEKEGKLPPDIDKNQIKHVLENHIKNCPVCNSELNDDSRVFMEELLKKLDLSSETSNYLMSIKSSLEIALNRCAKYKQIKDEILKKENYLQGEIENAENELNKISNFFAHYTTDDDQFNIGKIEEKRRFNYSNIRTADITIASNKAYIENNTKRLEIIEKEIEQLEAKKASKDSLTKKVRVLRKLTNTFESIKNSIMFEIKDEIQNETWHVFESMIWKQNTFGSLSINDRYELAVYNINKKEMTGSLSATEYMALAYSFTLAIHKASGKNCPLVVDSPLGRVSDDNRVNMATELLKVSMDKQIIMLFTPDEYSSEVKAVYEPNACNIRDIILSDDEKQIIKVGN